MLNKFPINLRNLRKKRNISQEELADLLGYSSKNVSKWENGQSLPDIHTLKMICDIFDIENINLLYDSLLPFSFLNHENDLKIISKYKLSFSNYDLEIYYKIQELKTNINFPVEEYDNVFQSLYIFKEYGILDEFKILISEEKLTCQLELNQIVNNQSFGEVILKIEGTKLNLSNDNDYKNYVESLNLSRQCSIVLDYIDKNMDLNFSLSELYNEHLIDTLSTLYPKNNDIKKIIRTSLSKLVDSNIIVKLGYSKYKKIHHKISNDYLIEKDTIEFLNKKITIDINDNFQGKNILFQLQDFYELKLNNDEIVLTLLSYFLYLINISVIESFVIEVNFDIGNDLLNSEYIILNTDIEKEVNIKYV